VPDDQPDPAVSTFTANLRKTRKQGGLTQEQVALASGSPQAHYSRIETGSATPASEPSYESQEHPSLR
jgi:transcriptional regulator with XRE-family HTH domain